MWKNKFHGGKGGTRRHWTCCSLVGLLGYTFYFSLLFCFISISTCKYSFIYIYWVCTILNKLDIFLIKIIVQKIFFLIKESFFFLTKILKNVFRKIEKLFLMKIQKFVFNNNCPQNCFANKVVPKIKF